MRWTLALTLGLSLTAHVGVATALFWPRREPPPPPLDPAPALAGETFELPAPETTDVPLANASPSPETSAPPVAAEGADAPVHQARPAHGKPAARASREGRPSGGRAEGAQESTPGGTGASGMYGAVGDRSAQELSTAFLRAFALTASADPAWKNAPLGSAGEVAITITLDESGHISGFVVGGSPSVTLRRGLERTMGLVKNRSFVAKGKVTKLHFAAAVVDDATNAFGIDALTGSFTLPIGRRIDLRPLQ